MAVHIAYMKQCKIDPLGRVVDPLASTTTYRTMLDTSTDWRVIPDAAIPSTGNPSAFPPTTYPNFSEYVTREETAGFRLGSFNQTMIVTYSS